MQPGEQPSEQPREYPAVQPASPTLEQETTEQPEEWTKQQSAEGRHHKSPKRVERDAAGQPLARIEAEEKLVHEPHRMTCSPKLDRPELFTLVSIDAFQGRTLEAKRSLYHAIVANLEPLGIPGSHVKILLRELPRENWGIRGGQAACDVELGFKVDV